MDQIWWQLISDDLYGFIPGVHDALQVQGRQHGFQGLEKEDPWQDVVVPGS